MTQIINGEKKEIYLCQSCAAQAGNTSGIPYISEMSISFDNFFQGLLETFFTHQKQKLGEPDHAGGQCARCGLTYADFRNTGRLGCGQCYDAFREQIAGIFKSIQAGQSHEGKLPKRTGVQLGRKKRILTLQSALAKAVEKEEYEEAAILRDEIRAIQSNAEHAAKGREPNE